jgi:polysaccharide export outer membrane protein
MLRKSRKQAGGVWAALVMALVLFGQPLMATQAEGEQAEAPPAVTEGYRIGAGDVLSIAVWKNNDLTRDEIQVLPDGRISFPLIGELEVAELTVAELTETLKEKLEPFLPDPQLSVSVKNVNSQLIYVIGRVPRAGRFVLNGNINVLQALALAGGLTPFAERGDIKVFRTENGKTTTFGFDYDAVTEDNALDQNVQLKRGDVIVVP